MLPRCAARIGELAILLAGSAATLGGETVAYCHVGRCAVVHNVIGAHLQHVVTQV